jgi:hypothetical protein
MAGAGAAPCAHKHLRGAYVHTAVAAGVPCHVMHAMASGPEPVRRANSPAPEPVLRAGSRAPESDAARPAGQPQTARPPAIAPGAAPLRNAAATSGSRPASMATRRSAISRAMNERLWRVTRRGAVNSPARSR